MRTWKFDYRYQLILIGIVILILIFAGSKHIKKPKEQIIYNNNGMTVKLVQEKLGGVEVSGENSKVIENYLNTVLDTSETISKTEIEITYEKEPSIEMINNILAKQIKTQNFKKEAKYITKIYEIIQSCGNQEENSTIITSMIENNSNLTYMTEIQIEAKIAQTSIKGEKLNELNQSIIELQKLYLNEFNVTPV